MSSNPTPKLLFSNGSFSGKDGYNCADKVAEEGWSCMSSIATFILTVKIVNLQKDCCVKIRNNLSNRREFENGKKFIVWIFWL